MSIMGPRDVSAWLRRPRLASWARLNRPKTPRWNGPWSTGPDPIMMAGPDDVGTRIGGTRGPPDLSKPWKANRYSYRRKRK